MGSKMTRLYSPNFEDTVAIMVAILRTTPTYTAQSDEAVIEAALSLYDQVQRHITPMPEE